MKLSKRARLFSKDPHCFWCDGLLRETTKPIRGANVATIEHLYSRLHPKGKDHWQSVVLACFGRFALKGYVAAKVRFLPKKSFHSLIGIG